MRSSPILILKILGIKDEIITPFELVFAVSYS